MGVMDETDGWGRTRRACGALLAALGALVLASSGCGSAGGAGATGGAATTGAQDEGATSRPALAQVSALARLGVRTSGPIAALADPGSGPKTLSGLRRKLAGLSNGSARVLDSVERTKAPLPAAVIAAAKLQARALDRAATLARELAKLEDEANRDRVASPESQSELAALAADAEDLQPVAERVGKLQEQHLSALRRLLRSAQRIARRAGVVAPTDVSADLRGDPALSEDLSAAVSRVSATISSLAGNLAPAADVVVNCGDDPGIYRLSARNLTCDEAHQLAVASVGALAPTFTVAGFDCAILGRYAGPEPGVFYGADDVRCEQGDRAIQFDFAD